MRLRLNVRKYAKNLILAVAMINTYDSAFAQSTGPTFGTTIVHYPRPETSFDNRSSFPLNILRLVLKNSTNQYVLRESNVKMDQNRALLQLQVGSGDVDVVWTMTSPDRESRFRPVRIPLDKGLFGWRLLLISKKNSNLFKSVKNLNDLKKWVACQGHDWPDTKILIAAGLQVRTSPNYDNLFAMTSRAC